MRNGMQIALALVTLCGVLHASEPDETPRTQLDNPVERILLCTPQGPLIVQLSLTVEGQPYRYAAEKVVDEHFELLTPETRSWGAAFENGQLLAGRLLRYQTPDARAKFVAKHDRDGDRMVTRSELRSALLDMADGDTLRLVHDFSSGNSTDQLFSLVDANGDWRLSTGELQQAPLRLAQVDFSGNEGLSLTELERAAPRREFPVSTSGVLLGREGSSRKVVTELRAHYANARGAIVRRAFAIAPELFDRLDIDRDGELQDSELLRIASLPAQITLAVDYANSRLSAPQWFQLKGTSADLQFGTNESSPTAVQHSWWKGENALLVSGAIASHSPEPKESARVLIKRLDANQNGYLEPTEARLFGDFAAWDLNSDGMVFPEELATALARQAVVGSCWIEIEVIRHPPRLWDQLDINGDLTLGVRELRQFAEVLARYDADGDGEVAYNEMPCHMEVILRRGGADMTNFRLEDREPKEVTRRGPKWFQRMDRNGDGDVSEREFLGTAEQFKRLDADHDGLLDRSEAEAAGS